MSSATYSIDDLSSCDQPPRAPDCAGVPLILLVEDDARTLRFITTLLKYATTARVLEASDPASALSAAESAGRPVDLLLSDIDLSAARNGIDLANELTSENPGMRVVLMSARDLARRELPLEWRFLSKPFAIAALLACMDELGFPVSAQWRAG